MAKKHQRWTTNQINHLLYLRGRGFTYSYIAGEMGRTTAAVTAKAKELKYNKEAELARAARLEAEIAPKLVVEAPAEPQTEEAEAPAEPETEEAEVPEHSSRDKLAYTMIAAFILFGAASAADLIATLVEVFNG